MLGAIQKFVTTNGTLVRSAEAALILGFAIAVWESGGDMTIAIPLILAGIIVSALIVTTATSLSRTTKAIAAAGVTIFFVVEGYCVYWHYHPTDAANFAGAILGLLGAISIWGWLWLLMAAFIVAFLSYVRRIVSVRVQNDSAAIIKDDKWRLTELETSHLLWFALNEATVAFIDDLIQSAPQGGIPQNQDADAQNDAYETLTSYIRKVVSATHSTDRGISLMSILQNAEYNAEHKLTLYLEESPERNKDVVRLRRYFIAEEQRTNIVPFLRNEREEVMSRVRNTRGDLINAYYKRHPN
jgi:hypothetical protein